MTRLTLIALAVVATAACGSSPSAPSAPTPTSLTIAGNDALPTNFFSTYTATLTLSNGTTQAVTPSWSVDNPNVATIDQSGKLTGLAHGTVGIIASAQGRTGTKLVHVVNNYGGSWNGTYRLTSCDQSGDFASFGWCQARRVGSIYQIALSLTQSGNGADQIAGTTALGTLSGNVTGNVTGDGHLNLGGTFVSTGGGFTAIITIGGWDTVVNPATGMQGGWAQNISSTGARGNAFETAQLVVVTHATPQRTGATPLSSMPAHLGPFADLFRLLAR